MAHTKIDYGIDLGTTNSSICRMELGVPTIKKSDTLSDTTPSCVSINRKNIMKVGASARNNLMQEYKARVREDYTPKFDAYIEFKRTMGTDRAYESRFAGRSFSSEELSAEVLKTLKSYITDENFSSVVITVPAKFTVNQKNATIEAARLAGFSQCELLQEPIAAAMAYGVRNSQHGGIWLVFDFGGGTFDAALLKTEDGILQVFDTEGDNYLGGKDLDYAIVDAILMPYLRERYRIEDEDALLKFRDALKPVAEEVKNQLSLKEREDILTDAGELGEDDDGEDIEIDMTVTRGHIEDVMRPIFQKAVDTCKRLLERNSLSSDRISKIILVGGPTMCPVIRQMLREQISENVDCSIDPMTPVAIGAALYASTMDNNARSEQTPAAAVKLNVGYESTTVEDSEWVTVAIDESQSLTKLSVEVVSADGTWSTGRQDIDTDGNVFEVEMIVKGKANVFKVNAFDETGNRVAVFPDSFSIIHGTKIGAAPLPYNIAIAIYDEDRSLSVIKTIRGLEKNKTLPATGLLTDRYTTSELRSGHPEDTVKIPIYQVDGIDKDGSRSGLYEYVGDVLVTGQDVNRDIPADSRVSLKIRVDTSEMMTVEVTFADQNIRVERELSASKKQKEAEAQDQIDEFVTEGLRSLDELEQIGVNVAKLRSDLNGLISDNEVNSEKKAVLQHLKEIMREIEEVEKQSQWTRVKHEMDALFEKLKKANEDLGNSESSRKIFELEEQASKIVAQKDVASGKMLVKAQHQLFVELTIYYQIIGLIKDLYNRFDSIRWKDAAKAKQVLFKALAIIKEKERVEELRAYCAELFDLLPREELSNAEGLLR